LNDATKAIGARKRRAEMVFKNFFMSKIGVDEFCSPRENTYCDGSDAAKRERVQERFPGMLICGNT
jgi:hypothetical protein